jgi:hypothetical protein
MDKVYQLRSNKIRRRQFDKLLNDRKQRGWKSFACRTFRIRSSIAFRLKHHAGGTA